GAPLVHVEVAPADAGGRHAQDGLVGLRDARRRLLLDAHLALALVDDGLHPAATRAAALASHLLARAAAPLGLLRHGCNPAARRPRVRVGSGARPGGWRERPTFARPGRDRLRARERAHRLPHASTWGASACQTRATGVPSSRPRRSSSAKTRAK